MVVDLAIDGENDAVIGVGKGLGTALWLCVSSHAFEGGGSATYRRPRYSDAHGTRLSQEVSKACATRNTAYTHWASVLVSLQMMLPPVEPPIVSLLPSRKEVHVTQFLLQSGPLCRILQRESQLSCSQTSIGSTYAFESFSAVGLNFCTSGCLRAHAVSRAHSARDNSFAMVGLKAAPPREIAPKPLTREGWRFVPMTCEYTTHCD